MDHIKFAQLVGFISTRDSNSEMEDYELEKLERLASACFPQPPLSPAVPSSFPSVPEHARNMLAAMADNRKIGAIQIYRILTGDGLKEAKDAVEAAMKPIARVLSYDPKK